MTPGDAIARTAGPGVVWDATGAAQVQALRALGYALAPLDPRATAGLGAVAAQAVVEATAGKLCGGEVCALDRGRPCECRRVALAALAAFLAAI